MFVEFYEYNVHPTDRNEYVLLVKPDVVYLNGKPCRNKYKVHEIVKLCNQKFEDAIKLTKETNYNYKGCRQCNLAFQICGIDIVLDGNGTNEQVRKFYEEFKRQIEEILNSNE